jgi:hypothetical protein
MKVASCKECSSARDITAQKNQASQFYTHSLIEANIDARIARDAR